MSAIPFRPVYSRRAVPPNYDAGWLATEFAGVQRALPVAAIRTATSSETVKASDQTVLYNATGGPISATLPSAGQVQGLTVTLKKIDASGNAVTVVGTVDGSANPTLASQWKSLTVQSDGTAWYKLAAV